MVSYAVAMFGVENESRASLGVYDCSAFFLHMAKKYTWQK